MYELRILSGLHRGATLPLDDESLRIGASEMADVVLVDPGIKEDHATLSRSDSGWVLLAVDGSLFGSESNQAETIIDIVAGDCVRLEQVWIMVASVDSAWPEPPPIPADEPYFDAAELDAEPMAEAEADLDAEPETMAAAPADSSTSAESEEGEAPEPVVEKKGFSRRRMVFVPLAAVAVLSAAVAYGMTEKSNKDFDEHNKARPGAALKHIGAREPMTAMARTDSKQTGESTASTAAEKIRQAFRKKLNDADLLKQFELTLDEQSWTLQASLNEDEATRFERILKTFIEEHHLTFPIHAKVVAAEGMLPFQIRQVITGKDASIVTQDGERLYVGEEMKGVRLVAVLDNVLQFDGKRKLDVRW